MNEYDAMTRAELDKALESVRSESSVIPFTGQPDQEQNSGDLSSLVHELEVHQIELEIQNRELRETREDLEVSRDRYASLYDFAPIGYLTLDDKGRIEEINLTGAMMLGRERARLMRKPLVAYVAKADAGNFMEHLRRCVQTGEQASVELDLALRGDRAIRVQLLSVPTLEKNDPVPVYRTAMIDVTARKVAEHALQKAHEELQARVAERTTELLNANAFLKRLISEREKAQTALQESEEKFRAMFEAARAGMVIADPQGRFLQVNRAFCEFLGYGEAELLKLRVLDITHPDDRRDTIEPAIEPADGSRKVIDLEKRYLRKDGRIVWGHLTSVFIQDSALKSIYSVAVIQNITDRKRLEDEIKQRNVELAAAVSSSLELSEVLDSLRKLLVDHLEIQAGGIFLYDEATDLFQLHSAWGLPAEILAKMGSFPASSFHDESDTPKPEGILSLEFRDLGAVAQELDPANLEWKSYLRIPLVAKGETQGVAALLGLGGREVGEDLISFFKTLGQHVGVAIQNARLFEEVRASRAQLQTLSQRLVELQEAERRDIARELHDQIGQQLTGLKLTLETCHRLPSKQAREALCKAQALADEVMARVHDLSLDLRPTILDDLGLVPALMWQFERYTASSGVRVAFEQKGLERRFDPAVETAAYRIVQEALTNVARHARVNEAVVRIWSNDSMLCVVIEDRGAGFDSRKALDSHSSSGLTGMRERALLLGGHLHIESGSGLGCRLTVELPLKTRALGPDADDGREENEHHNDSISR
ncbi:MAG: PAS domain S-box protein [Acidobacteriota bacterium]